MQKSYLSAREKWGAGQNPPQQKVTFGSADSDTFNFDANTFRLTQYQFKVGTQTVTGAVNWNPNGSLGSLNITDQFNSSNTQNCNYTADDLARINKGDCGTIWGQTFSYDAFGNISKAKISGSGATSFNPTYQSSPSITNRVASVGGTNASYDANGNSLSDTFRSFTWDAENRPVTIGSVSLTYDALGRMVEQSVTGANSEIVYSPSGGKLSLMNGTSLIKAFAPLTGGATAVYTNGTGPAYYRHADHLSSSRFASTPSQTLYSDTAYSPFGEPYAGSGAIDDSFTGQNQDTTSGLYDFLMREHDPNQGRWTQPDPAGLTVVDPSNPQSWNRYSYVINNPLAYLDPSGLDFCSGNSPYGWIPDSVGANCAFPWPPWTPEEPPAPPPACPPGLPGCWGPSPDPPPGCPPPLVCATGGGNSGMGGGRSNTQQPCTPSVFNPSCKPPSCPAVYVQGIVKDLVGDGVSHAAAEGLAKPGIQAATQDAAVRYIAERGLVVPLRSSIVRRLLLTGEILGEVVAAAPIYYAEVVAFDDAYKQARAGTCTTIWSH